MNTIVYLGVPAHGHVNPTLPVVQELIERGEHVLYYNTEEFRPQIEQTGATFCAYPETEMTPAAFSALLYDGNIARISALLLRVTEPLLSFIVDQFSHKRPDLVIFDSLALWGKMATALLRLCSVASISHFVFEGAREVRKVPGALRLVLRGLKFFPAILSTRLRLIRHYGKDALSASGPLFPVRGALNIIFTARELHPDTPFIDQTFRFVGPSVRLQTQDAAFPDSQHQQPLIYISLGTIHSKQPAFYRCCFEAFAQYPAQFILSTGPSISAEELGPVPSNFMVHASVPQLRVLQQADVFITHGGLNSIHEGLLYGVPLIMVPQQFEQLLNALCMADRGVGLVLSKQLLQGSLTAADLRQALTTVLAEPGFSEAATTLQKLLHTTGGYCEAVNEIQQYMLSVEQ